MGNRRRNKNRDRSADQVSNNNDTIKRMGEEFAKLIDREIRLSRCSTIDLEPVRVRPSTSEQTYSTLQRELELKEKEIELMKREMALKERAAARPIFSFSDIEGSMQTFNGSDGYTLEKWIEDLEDAAEVYRWTDVQMATYGKRLLDGDAKVSLRTVGLITGWDELKKFLKEEFTPNENSAIIHQKMAKRVKKSDETYVGYLIALRELGNLAKLEDEAVIQYCIDGIKDHEPNKVILYGASTMKEFKKKLSTYEEMKKRMPARKEQPGTSTASSSKGSQSKRSHIRCHGVGECTNKDRGPRCYRCEEYGHLAKNCPGSSEKRFAW